MSGSAKLTGVNKRDVWPCKTPSILFWPIKAILLYNYGFSLAIFEAAGVETVCHREQQRVTMAQW